MAGGRFRDPSAAGGLVDASLDHGLIKLVSAPLSALHADVGACGRKYSLPVPLSAGVGIVSGKGLGQGRGGWMVTASNRERSTETWFVLRPLGINHSGPRSGVDWLYQA